MYNKLPIAIAILISIVAVNSAPADNSITAEAVSKQEHLQIIKRLERMQEAQAPAVRVYKANERLSPQELKELLYSVGFRDQALKEAWGTAMRESTGRPMAHNDNRKTGDNSYGLFQINMIDSLGPARLEKYGLESNEDLFDPLTNAEIAFQMSNGGKNWSAWNGITDSAKKWMKEFPE